MLFMALPSVLFSQNFDNVISDFLHRLTAKHKNVESLEISNIETRTVPGEDYRIVLFSSDILLFIMKDAIGL
jgi:hypothetical protein